MPMTECATVQNKHLCEVSAWAPPIDVTEAREQGRVTVGQPLIHILLSFCL